MGGCILPNLESVANLFDWSVDETSGTFHVNGKRISVTYTLSGRNSWSVKEAMADIIRCGYIKTAVSGLEIYRVWERLV